MKLRKEFKGKIIVNESNIKRLGGIEYMYIRRVG